jgi:large subunit ribosomal protein L24
MNLVQWLPLFLLLWLTKRNPKMKCFARYKSGGLGHLSKDLRNQLGKRSVTIVKGDRVVVTKGDFKGIEENVARVDRRKGQVFVNNVSRENAKGEKILVPMCPSSVIIIKLNEEDKRRLSKSKASVSGNKVETENKGED